MIRITKEAYITFLIPFLQEGTDAKIAQAEFCTKFQKTSRTFWTWWKLAQNRILDVQQAAQKEIAGAFAASQVERIKGAILTRDEALEILSKTARGIGSRLKNGEEMYPSYSERNAAIRLMGDMAGWKLAEKPSNEILTEEQSIPEEETPAEEVDIHPRRIIFKVAGA